MYPALESRDDILKMLEGIARSREKILERCARLTPAQLNDPVYAGTWSVLQNLVHLAWAEEWMLAWVRKRPEALTAEERPPQPAADLESVRTALDEAHAGAIAFLKANEPGVLKERCLYSRQGEQTVGGVLFHLIEHEFHHRAFVAHKLGVLEQRAKEESTPRA